MLDSASIITFNLVLLAAILSPGPAFLFIVTTSLSRGRAAGFAAGLGLGSMAALWTLLAVLGLEALMELVPGLYLAIRIAGAGYLLWMAVDLWRDNGPPDTEPSGDQVFSGGLHHLFMRGFIINLMNPKSVVFAASIIVMISPDSSSGSKLTCSCCSSWNWSSWSCDKTGAERITGDTDSGQDPWPWTGI